MFRTRQPYSLPALPISAPSVFSLFATKHRKLTPLFSYSSALFCAEQNRNPFRFIVFRTLCAKHPGGGAPLRTVLRGPTHASLRSAQQRPQPLSTHGLTSRFSGYARVGLFSKRGVSILLATFTEHGPRSTGHCSLLTTHCPLLTSSPLKPLTQMAHPYLCTRKKGPAAREPR